MKKKARSEYLCGGSVRDYVQTLVEKVLHCVGIDDAERVTEAVEEMMYSEELQATLNKIDEVVESERDAAAETAEE